MAKVRRTAITRLTIKNVRNLATDDRGKYKYESELNSVLKEIFGPKNLATRFGPKSSEKAFTKAINIIDFEALVAMMADNAAIKDIRVLVGITKALKSHKYTKKEVKRLRKAYKQIVSALIDEYDVKKSDFSDILTQVDKILDDGFYGFDDDDIIGFDLDGEDFWDDEDDSPYSRARSRYKGKRKKKGNVNELSRLLYGSDLDEDEDDDDPDDIRDRNMEKMIDLLGDLKDRIVALENDDDEDWDDGDDYEPEPPKRRRRGNNSGYEASEIFTRPRIDAPEVNEPVVRAEPPSRNEAPPESPEVIVMKDFMNQVAGDISDLASGFKSLRSDLDEVATNVADLMSDFYDKDKDDDDTEVADGGKPPGDAHETAYPIRDSDKKKGNG